MTTARRIAVLAALGVTAAIAGFAGTAWIAETGARPEAVLAAAPAASPEEGLLEQEPPPPPPRPPAPVAPPPQPPRADPEPPPPASRPQPAPDPEPAPVPAPAPANPRPEPEARPAPAEPPPDTEPEPPAAPSPPPSAVTAPPPSPPTGVVIPSGSLVSGHEPGRRALLSALARAGAGSTESADIRRLLELWRRYLGPDAQDAPAGRRATVARAVRDNAWWYSRRGSPRERVLLRDPEGIILTYRAGQGFAVNPVATTGRWRELNADVPAAALADALLPMGVERTAGGRGFLAWEYFDVAGDPAAIRPGASGMAQARVALVMAHAAADTGEARYASTALRSLAALTVDVDRGGVRSMVRVDPAQEPAPWYVERAYPDEDPWTGGALNGFMVTLLNLRGAAAVLDRAPGAGATGANLARDLADRGARTLARHLPDHDTGSWSYYGLLTAGRPWKTYLADLNYHCYHVRLLTQLTGPYPDLGFGETAARWQGYVDAAGATCPAR